MTKSTSKKQIAANRLNGKRGTGPKDTSSTRFNALKHGLTASGVTELDNTEGYPEMLRDLTNEKRPSGVVGAYLVESMALTIVRSRRVRRLEAEFITSILNPPTYKGGLTDGLAEQLSGTVVDPGLPAPMPIGSVQTLFNLFHRYGTGTEKQLFRILREYDRLGEKRRDQSEPAPAMPDVTVHNHNPALVSFTESTDTVAPLSGSPDNAEEQNPLTSENEATPSADLNIQVDAPDASFADAPADIQRFESAPPDESEEFKSLIPTEEAEPIVVNLNTVDNHQDLVPIVSPSEGEGLECSATGARAESEGPCKGAHSGEPETEETNEEDP
jgi:hypothetical protein